MSTETSAEPTDVIRLYLDDDKEPFKTARPPLRFQFSTLHLADGLHRLRVEAHNGLAGESVREIPFHVRNGVAITVSGIQPNQEIAGQVGVIINAYAGNTEVDFEPSRAETPQPIPTWAWLIFLAIVAWTMFYILNPSDKYEIGESAGVSTKVGTRVYEDVCAKCHGEDGLGAPGFGPARLKDSETVLNEDPVDLVSYVAAGPLPEGVSKGAEGSGKPRVRMLPFGPPRLTPLEFVAVLNYIRSHWGNQAPPIIPVATRAAKDIREFDASLVDAIQKSDATRLAELYSHERQDAVRLVRPNVGTDNNPPVDVSSNELIVKTLMDWAASVGFINSITATNAAYVTIEGGNIVYAHGGQQLSVTPREGPSKTYSGHFIRVYVKECAAPGPDGKCARDANGELVKQWRLAFDYATTPMPIGCGPVREGERCPVEDVGRVDYAQVQRILGSLGEKAPKAPHGNFWELPYADFVGKEFPFPSIPNAKIRLVNLNTAAGITGTETNLVKALRDGKDVVLETPEGPRRIDIQRMPKGAKPMAPADIGRIISWLDHGMPERISQGPIKPPGMGETGKPPSMGEAASMGEAGTMGEPEKPPAMGEPAAGDWRADDLDFPGVVALLKALNPKSSGSPHGSIWTFPYDKFVAYEFEIPSDGTKARLIEKGKPDRSNLILALEGKPLIVTKDGKETTHDMEGSMPPRGKGAKPAEKDLELLRRWVLHGAPESKPAGAGGTPPSPPATAPAEPAPSSAPAPTPAPTAPPAAAPTPSAPGPAPSGGAATSTDDLDFAGVVALLKALNPKASGSPHGSIWTYPYEKFIAYEFEIPSDSSKAKLLVKGDPESSNLVRALEGKKLLVTIDGKQSEHEMESPMPPKGKGRRATPEEIAKVRRWIEKGAPEKLPAK